MPNSMFYKYAFDEMSFSSDSVPRLIDLVSFSLCHDFVFRGCSGLPKIFCSSVYFLLTYMQFELFK